MRPQHHRVSVHSFISLLISSSFIMLVSSSSIHNKHQKHTQYNKSTENKVKSNDTMRNVFTSNVHHALHKTAQTQM